MTEIILGLGSNLGDRENNLRKAISLAGGLLADIEESSIHKSAPLLLPNSPPEWNQQYFNMVIAGKLVDEKITPLEFLQKIKDIETLLGRKPAPRWSPREIDIDILTWGNEEISLPDLKIPHPEMETRDFVLRPLYEIRPNWLPPSQKKLLDAKISHKSKRNIFVRLFNLLLDFIPGIPW